MTAQLWTCRIGSVSGDVLADAPEFAAEAFARRRLMACPWGTSVEVTVLGEQPGDRYLRTFVVDALGAAPASSVAGLAKAATSRRYEVR